MNEQEHASQLSALYDDELSAARAELVIRRALKDPQLRETWGRYALIGAAMRGEPLAVHGQLRDDVASRVSALLVNEAELPASAGAMPAPAAADDEGRRGVFARGAWGMAIAASVAAVSLVVMRNQAPADLQPAPMLADAGSAQVLQPADGGVTGPATQADPLTGELLAAGSPPPSYTTPLDNTPPGQQVSAPLVNYVVAHSDLAASAVRFSPLSSVMSASYDLAQGTVEMSEAEIGAHR